MDYCKIYLSSNLERFEIVEKINFFLNGEKTPFFSIKKDGILLEIKINDEYDPIAGSQFPDGFLFFRYIIEVFLEDINEDINKDERFVHLISNVLLFMWENQYPAIASCTFEEVLPENGGYNSRKIPWLYQSG